MDEAIGVEAHDLVVGDVLADKGLPIVEIQVRTGGLIGIRYGPDKLTGATPFIFRSWSELVRVQERKTHG